jgi:hypothetical protein
MSASPLKEAVDKDFDTVVAESPNRESSGGKCKSSYAGACDFSHSSSALIRLASPTEEPPIDTASRSADGGAGTTSVAVAVTVASRDPPDPNPSPDGDVGCSETSGISNNAGAPLSPPASPPPSSSSDITPVRVKLERAVFEFDEFELAGTPPSKRVSV